MNSSTKTDKPIEQQTRFELIQAYDTALSALDKLFAQYEKAVEDHMHEYAEKVVRVRINTVQEYIRLVDEALVLCNEQASAFL